MLPVPLQTQELRPKFFFVFFPIKSLLISNISPVLLFQTQILNSWTNDCWYFLVSLCYITMSLYSN